jgi:hypothetical protein
MWSFVAVAACVVLVGCAGKTHAKSAATTVSQSPAVSGPVTVDPGKTVRFTASGFRPGSVEVVLAPADKLACCAARIQPAFTVPGNGTAVMTFAIPTFYKRCTAAGVCKRVAWRPGEKVVVTVSGYLEEAKMTTRIRSRNL